MDSLYRVVESFDPIGVIDGEFWIPRRLDWNLLAPCRSWSIK